MIFHKLDDKMIQIYSAEIFNGETTLPTNS